MMTMWDLTVEVGRHDRRPNVSPAETARLHGRLGEWYARTPRPIGRPTLAGDCPEDDQKTLFDQYYYMLVATLYRPRSLANPPPEQIKMLHEATSTALDICAKIQAQGKLFDVSTDLDRTTDMAELLPVQLGHLSRWNIAVYSPAIWREPGQRT